MGRYPTLPEAVAFERGNEPFREPFTQTTNKIRRLLLHGEVLTADQVAQITGKSPWLLVTIMKKMKEWGFRFEEIPRPDGVKAYRLVNRDHVPTQAPPPHTKGHGRGLPRGFNTAPRRNVIAALHSVGGTITDPSGNATGKLGELLGGKYQGLSGLLLGMGRDELIIRDNVSPRTNQPTPKRMYGYALNYQHRYVRSLVGDRPSEPVPASNGAASNGAEPVDDGRVEPEPEPVEAPGGELVVRAAEPIEAIEAVATIPSELMLPPQLDQELKVFMVYRDPVDGTVKVGIHNGRSQWMATIDGHVDAGELQNYV